MDYIEKFKEELNRQDKAENTINGYERDLKDFKKFFTEKTGSEFYPGEIVQLDIKEYRSYLLNVKKQSSGTINHKLIALDKYFDYLTTEKVININPAAGVKKIKVQKKRMPGSIDRNIVYKLRREFYKGENKRDIAIFEILYQTGIRVSEMINIDLDDFEITDRKGSLTVRRTKGNKPRTIPLNKDVRKAIQDYLVVRPKVVSNKLLIGERGPLRREAVHKVIKKYTNRVELEGYEISAHSFRHQFAYDLLDSGEDIVTVAELLGHSDINVTRRYTLPSEEDKHESVEKLVSIR